MYRPLPTIDDAGMALSTAHTRSHAEYFVAEESATPGILWPAVYLDTSVVSYLTARLNSSILIARRQRLTRVWWHRYRENHACCISDLVLAEAADGNRQAADERLQALSGIAALRMNPHSRDLARQFIGGGLLPTSAASDAEHIAVAAANAVRILLTWNCKHLANPSIRDALVLACEKNRVRCPEIYTPEQLMRTYAYERPTS